MRAARRLPRPVVLALLAACAWLAYACDQFASRSPGESLWRERCAECHGLDGRGNTPRYMGNPWADLRDNSWKDTSGDAEDLGRLVREGVFGGMPGNPDLDDQQVRAVVGYLLKLRGENAQ